MKTIDSGLIEYQKALEIMTKLQENYTEDVLLFATHYPVFTVGESEASKFPWALKVDRGGSITYFDEGTLMCYYIFKVHSPPLFFRKIIKIYTEFFQNLNKEIYYDIKKPGFYIKNRKIASIGFNYKKNISKHGVSIHLNPNLDEFNKIKPCNLNDIIATSLKNESIFAEKSDIIQNITYLSEKYLGRKDE